MNDERLKEIVEAFKWLSLTPRGRQAAKIPDVTPLSREEKRAIAAAVAAADRGMNVLEILDRDWQAEMALQAPHDSRLGRITPLERLPSLSYILAADPLALDSSRVRTLFYDWLWEGPTDAEVRSVVRLLRKARRPEKGDLRDLLALAVHSMVQGLRETGLTEAEAVRHVAGGGGGPIPQEFQNLFPSPYPGFKKPISTGRLRTMLKRARWLLRLSPGRKPHKRPGKNKPESPGNPANSESKRVENAHLATLPVRRSTDAEGKRHDDLPYDYRSGGPAQDEAANPPSVEAQREGAAILQAVRKPRALRGRGADSVPRGPDVCSHSRGGDSTRRRPGRVKGKPP